ncbi:MAG: chemotaxis response regulator protein-glutamate methylesterase [Spirochaetes bacterium]|nr:chemotaxis response regulator protein-glutamate methylesterase [Spirochaetota bacterium]
MAVDRTKVIIIDDSASVRQVLSEILSSDNSIEVIAASSDPIIAMKYMEKNWPDVIISDIAMPRKDGITFVKEIMATRPTPVIICSALTEENAELSMNAIAAGAVSIISKPKIGARDFLYESTHILLETVKSAAKAEIKNLKTVIRHTEPKKIINAIGPPAGQKTIPGLREKIIAIGASAGGTQAIESILVLLPDDTAGIVIVQHMPEKFTEAFAKRLNSFCGIYVKEAAHNDRIEKGTALIAPGNRHLMIAKDMNGYYSVIKDGPVINHHKPSVDVLFRSVAQNASSNALGIILTGMGDDGAAGMLEMKNAGIKTIAQDKQTSVVYGMPAEAVKKGGVDKIIPLNAIHLEIINFSHSK